nr:hypothetical protein DGKKSRWO_DGKKSRWO_CDS_0197 [uncultured phage]CAI9752375.1 hypothetical protein CVNMHQAP_CVNMHQAP_CDS_0198 [uncultured phage]
MAKYKTTYKIKNISGCLSVIGLYPGETKEVEDIDSKLKTLELKNVISISTNKKLIKETIAKDEVCE